MEKIGYEGLAAQKNAHASFVARLESINLIELDENPQKIYGEPDQFLLGWLINHILYSDKKRFLSRHNRRGQALTYTVHAFMPYAF